MRRSLICLALAAALAAVAPSPTSAHILYYPDGSFLHVSHSRDYYFFNGASQSGWIDACRAAQLDYHNTMNGSLRFYSSSHDAALLHCLDYNYGDTGWIGRATHPGYNGFLCPHCGHSHLDMNTYYNFRASAVWQKQSVACHEIGHPVGLAHSADASDCMLSNYDWGGGSQYTLSGAHRDQLRAQYNGTGH